MTFFGFFLFFEIVTTRYNFSFVIKFHIFNGFYLKKTCLSAKKIALRRKNNFLQIFLFFLNRHIETKLVFLPKFHISNDFDLKKRVFRQKFRQTPNKWLFLHFSCFFEIVTSRQNLFVFTKIPYLQRFWFKKNVSFDSKFVIGQKNDFFRIFLVFLKSSHQEKTF